MYARPGQMPSNDRYGQHPFDAASLTVQMYAKLVYALLVKCLPKSSPTSPRPTPPPLPACEVHV